MKRCIAPVLILAMGTAHAGPMLEQLEHEQQAVFDRAAPSVVFIATPQGFGSGFFVTPQGLILTNAHVVGANALVDVVTRDGKKAKGRVVERGSDNTDLALIQIQIKDAPAMELGGVLDLRIGNWVASVGHGRGGIWTYNTGLVSNVYRDRSGQTVFQTQIPLNPGSSGGPIIDRHGRAVGIVTAGLTNSNAINFGIRIDVALLRLKRLALAGNCLIITAPRNVPVFVDKKSVGVGPRIVVPVGPGLHEVLAMVNGRTEKHVIQFPEVRTVTIGRPTSPKIGQPASGSPPAP